MYICRYVCNVVSASFVSHERHSEGQTGGEVISKKEIIYTMYVYQIVSTLTSTSLITTLTRISTKRIK